MQLKEVSAATNNAQLGQLITPKLFKTVER